jgi:prepilin-type N-terminal cleavage/methylation domain-containing protein
LSASRLKDESGYSLVEVMVAIMLLALAIIPMVGMFDAGLRAVTQGSSYDKARAIANGELEEIKSQDFSKIVSSYPPVNGSPAGGSVACSAPIESGFGCQVRTSYVASRTTSPPRIEADSNARTMVEIAVTVTWGSNNSYSTTGLVSK